MKSTIRDIARAAQVSTATVDRVLNHRPGVKATNRHRVLEAAARLGYLPETGNLAMPARPAQLEFILCRWETNLFLDELAWHLEDFCRRLPLVSSCRMHRLTTRAARRIHCRARRTGPAHGRDRCRGGRRSAHHRAAIARISEAGDARRQPSCRICRPRNVPTMSASTTASPGGPPANSWGRCFPATAWASRCSSARASIAVMRNAKRAFAPCSTRSFPNIAVAEAVETDDSSTKGYQAAISIFDRQTRARRCLYRWWRAFGRHSCRQGDVLLRPAPTCVLPRSHAVHPGGTPCRRARHRRRPERASDRRAGDHTPFGNAGELCALSDQETHRTAHHHARKTCRSFRASRRAFFPGAEERGTA